MSPSLRIPTSRQSSISSSVLGTSLSLSGSARVVPVDTDSFSDSTPTPKTYDINGKEVQEPLCMICLSNFQDGDILSLLPCACGHQYHRVCLISWLERKVTCPLCTVSVGGLLLGNHQNSLSRLPQSDSVIQARQHVRTGDGDRDRDGDDNTQTNPLNRNVDLSSEVVRSGDRNIDIDIEDGRGQRYMDSASASASVSALPIATPVTIPPPSPAFVSAQSVPGRERGRGRGRILSYNGAPHSSI